MTSLHRLVVLAALCCGVEAAADEYEISFPTDTTGAVLDTTLDEVFEDDVFGAKAYMAVGIEKSTDGGAQRALIHFDDLFTDDGESPEDGVPYDSAILVAQLVLDVREFEDEFESFPSAFQLYAARVLEEWDEDEATWNHAVDGVSWSADGCGEGCSADATDVVAWAPDESQIRIDVKKFLELWVTGEEAMHGLVIYLAASELMFNADDATVVRFEIASTEGEAKGHGVPPYLRIEYAAPDADADGFDVYSDCDDDDDEVNPAAEDVPGNGVDEDCDGVDAEEPEPEDSEIDVDGDRYAASVDCDDADAAVFPGAYETCEDGIDQDCDGLDPMCETSFRQPIPCGCSAGAGSFAAWWLMVGLGWSRRRRD